MTASTTSDRALRALGLSAALAMVTACSGGDRPPPAGGGDIDGGASSNAGQAGASSGGSSGQASTGGAAGSGSGGETGGASGSGAAAGTGFEPIPEPDVDPLCSDAMSARAPAKLEISTGGQDVFASVTADERVLAWMTFEGAVTTLYTASREEADGAFDAPIAQVVATPDPVTLGRDGTEVVLVDADRRGFSVLRRASLDVEFEAASGGAFAVLEADADSGVRYADPVLANGDLSFYYSRLDAGGRREPFVSYRFSPYAAWPPGVAVALADSLAERAPGRLRVTSASRDGRTLFLWNDARSVTVAASLDRETLEFSALAELGSLSGATPNADCSRLYHSSAADLFVTNLR